MPARDTGTLNRSKTSTALPSSSPSKLRKLSSSMDHLYVQDDPDGGLKKSKNGASIDRLDAEPYLQPMEVQRVMGQSIGQSMRLKDHQHRNIPGFMSMRVPKRTSQPLLHPMKTSPGKEKGNSLDRKTHKRSHSNPHMLETVADYELNPPELPPRNLDSMGTPTHKTGKPENSNNLLSPVESSLEFSSPTSTDTLRRLSDKPLLRPSDKPLPPIPDSSPDVNPKNAVMRNRIFTSKSVDCDGVGDGDNLSQISGPFEEIDDMEKRSTEKFKQGASLPDLAGSSSTLPPCSPISNSNGGGGDGSIEDDQYAQIEEFQQYMQMASAPVKMDKSKTLPLLQILPQSQGEESAVPLPLSRRAHAKSVSALPISSQPPGKLLKRETISSVSGAPLISTLKKRLKKSPRNEPPIPEESKNGMKSPTPPPLPKHANRTCISGSATNPIIPHDIRPLPPSPTKGLSGSSNITRKISSGSNIYEVIDEEFVNRLTNRPSRQGSRRDLAEWAPPVDRSLWPQYLEVTRTFFSLPQVQELWLDTVKSIMGDIDPEEIFPPYFNLSPESVTGAAEGLQDVAEESEQRQEEDMHGGERPESNSPLNAGTKLLTVHGTVPPVNTPEGDEGRIPIHLHPTVPPHQNKKLDSSSATGAGFGPQDSSRRSLELAANSDQLIMMLNQCQLYDSDDDDDDDSSSDADEDDQDEFDSESSSDSDFGSDLDVPLKLSHSSHKLVTSDLLTSMRPASPPPSLPKLPDPEQPDDNVKLQSPKKQPPKPKPKPKPRKVSLQKPDSITTSELRAMDSNDSDKVSTDSAITKSPRSIGVGDFDMDHVTSEDGEGVEVVHNVRPSQVFKKRAMYRLTSPKESGKMRGDSGTFEEEDSLPRTPTAIDNQTNNG